MLLSIVDALSRGHVSRALTVDSLWNIITLELRTVVLLVSCPACKAVAGRACKSEQAPYCRERAQAASFRRWEQLARAQQAAP